MSRKCSLYKTVLLKQLIIKDAKLSEDDKYAFEPTVSDCGYFSGGNIVDSGDIKPEEEEQEVPETKAPEEQVMRLDSGVDLSSSFSGLNIRSEDLNDLTSKKKIILEPAVEIPKQDESWEAYFQQDEDGNTVLHYAIAERELEAVLALIRRAPHPFLLDIPNDNAQTPVHIAAATGQWKIVRWLIVAGAKPCPRNIQGDSPLHIAARNNDGSSCKAITDPVQKDERRAMILSYAEMPQYKADLDQWNYEGQTCVHVAAIEGHIEPLRHLVAQGADINARDGRSGYTALHYAIERRDMNLLNFLLNECKELNTTAVTYGGKGALQLGYVVPFEIAETLRSRGAESPYTSEDESESESESESMYEIPSNLYHHNLVGASA